MHPANEVVGILREILMHYDIRFGVAFDFSRQRCPCENHNSGDAFILEALPNDFLANAAGWTSYYYLHGMSDRCAGVYFSVH
jgi:hypothetical protein